jgi:hypothetical protein
VTSFFPEGFPRRTNTLFSPVRAREEFDELSRFAPPLKAVKWGPPFDLLMALSDIDGLRVNLERAPVFRPGSRKVHSAYRSSSSLHFGGKIIFFVIIRLV